MVIDQCNNQIFKSRLVEIAEWDKSAFIQVSIMFDEEFKYCDTLCQKKYSHTNILFNFLTNKIFVSIVFVNF